MSRHASPFTVAARNLFVETNGTITHMEARPRLAALGITLAAEPGEKSEDLKKLEEALVASKAKFPKNENEQKKFFEEHMKAAGIPATHLKNLRDEYMVNRAFINERNTFNVMKTSWKNAGRSTSVSQKPVANITKKGQDAKNASVITPRRGRPAKVAPTQINEMDAVKYIYENGGMSAVQKQIEDLQAKLDHLQAVIEVGSAVAESLAA